MARLQPRPEGAPQGRTECACVPSNSPDGVARDACLPTERRSASDVRELSFPDVSAPVRRARPREHATAGLGSLQHAALALRMDENRVVMRTPIYPRLLR